MLLPLTIAIGLTFAGLYSPWHSATQTTEGGTIDFYVQHLCYTAKTSPQVCTKWADVTGAANVCTMSSTLEKLGKLLIASIVFEFVALASVVLTVSARACVAYVYHNRCSSLQFVTKQHPTPFLLAGLWAIIAFSLTVAAAASTQKSDAFSLSCWESQGWSYLDVTKTTSNRGKAGLIMPPVGLALIITLICCSFYHCCCALCYVSEEMVVGNIRAIEAVASGQNASFTSTANRAQAPQPPQLGNDSGYKLPGPTAAPV